MTVRDTGAMTIDEVRAYLHSHIPLTRAMEVEVEEVGREGVRLTAPLAPNINHRSTVFGGSASALAILSAWTLVHTRLHAEGLGSRVVIQRNEMEYLHPVHGGFAAWCPAPPEEKWERFARAIRRRGRGRIELEAHLLAAGETVGAFRGTYVALFPDTGPA